jgi:hypothetical protein
MRSSASAYINTPRAHMCLSLQLPERARCVQSPLHSSSSSFSSLRPQPLLLAPYPKIYKSCRVEAPGKACVTVTNATGTRSCGSLGGPAKQPQQMQLLRRGRACAMTDAGKHTSPNYATDATGECRPTQTLAECRQAECMQPSLLTAQR